MSLEFTADEWLPAPSNMLTPSERTEDFSIAACGGSQLPEGMLTAMELCGKQVMIDGREYKVIGTDTCMVNHLNSRCCAPFGLLVRTHGI